MKKLIIVFLLVLIVGVGIGIYVKMHPKVEEVAYTLYEEEKMGIVLKDETIIMDPLPKLVGDVIYLPLEFIITYIEEDFFLDENNQLLTYTTYDHVYKVIAGDELIEIDGAFYDLENIFLWQEDTMYVPIDFILSHFKMRVDYKPLYNLLVIDIGNEPITTGHAVNDMTYLYKEPEDTSEVLLVLDQKEALRLFDDNSGDWVKVRSEDGVIGYIRRADIEHINVDYNGLSFNSSQKKNVRKNITMVWHQVFNQEANGLVEESFSNVVGLEVISPTWFSLANREGDLSSLANHDYVNWAHSNGYEIWPLIDNQFDADLTHEVLADTDKRKYLIDEILQLALTYNLDGINIDFESVAKETGPYYVQFIRELAPILRQQGITLSIDTYVPSGWTRHYERDELAQYADYIIIMGYDEHWAGSEEAGSVSSIGFVGNAIINTLKEVPAEKIILGVPFYTRLWGEQEIDGEITLTSKALGIESAYNLIERENVEINWLEEVGQYYAEFVKDDITYKVWLEDTKSLEEKFSLVKEHNIAGISAWKKNLESDDIWSLIETYFE